jgi:RNA polymerase sigma-70 factor (ECF subfamily)
MVRSHNLASDNLASERLDDNGGLLAQIYTSFAKDMYRYGLTLCADKHMVEDAIHDIMLDFALHSDKLSNIVDLKFYVLKAFRNRLMLLQKNNAAYTDFDPKTMDVEHVQDVEQLFIVNEEDLGKRRMAQQMLLKLTVIQREVLHLRFSEMLSFNEIATLMGIQRQSAQNLFQRAVFQLKNKFTKK